MSWDKTWTSHPTLKSPTTNWMWSMTLCTWALSTISDALYIDMELNRCISKAATNMPRLRKRVWPNKQFEYTKILVYKALIVSTLLSVMDACKRDLKALDIKQLPQSDLSGSRLCKKASPHSRSHMTRSLRQRD